MSAVAEYKGDEVQLEADGGLEFLAVHHASAIAAPGLHGPAPGDVV